MFLPLAYKQLQIVSVSKNLVYKCHEVSNSIPEEGGHLAEKIRAEIVEAHINISRGAFLNKKNKRKKLFKTAQYSLVAVDASLEAVLGLKYVSKDQLTELSTLLISCYKLLNKLIRK